MNSSALLPNSCATYSAQLRSFIYMSMGHHGLATSESTFPMLRTNFWTTWLRILKSCVSQRLIYSKIIVHCQHHLIWAWCFTMFQSYFRHWPPCLMCVEVRPWSDSSRVVLCVRGSLRAGQRDYVQNHCFATRLRRSVCLSQRKIAIFAMTKTSLIKSELTSKNMVSLCFCVWMLAGCGSKQDKTTTWQHIQWLKKCRKQWKDIKGFRLQSRSWFNGLLVWVEVHKCRWRTGNSCMHPVTLWTHMKNIEEDEWR